ncbi:FAD binding domain-containing protein, partial [Pseudonocardia sulfidoxydans]
MKPPPLRYLRAHDPEEAVELLAEYGDEAKVIAGGQSLVPLLNFRLARPSVLVDIGAVTPWATLVSGDRSLELGALTTHLRIERAGGTEPFRGLEVLPRTASLIGHLPIRSRGTIGGSLAHGDPAAEWCILAVLLDAEATLCSGRGERRVPLTRLLQGFFTTTIAPDEVLTAVTFPRTGAAASLVEHAPRHGDFALVAAAA